MVGTNWSAAPASWGRFGRCQTLWGLALMMIHSLDFDGGLGRGGGLGAGGLGLFTLPSLRMPRIGGGAGLLAMDNDPFPLINSNDSLLILKEALRHTEMRLEDLEKNATSAERRLGWFTTAAAALASVTFLYAHDMPTPAIAVISGLGLTTSAVLAIWIALPRNFHVRGHFWRDWKGHIDDGDILAYALEAQANENDARLINNESELARMAKNFRHCFNLLFWSVCLNLGGQIGSLF